MHYPTLHVLADGGVKYICDTTRTIIYPPDSFRLTTGSMEYSADFMDRTKVIIEGKGNFFLKGAMGHESTFHITGSRHVFFLGSLIGEAVATIFVYPGAKIYLAPILQDLYIKGQLNVVIAPPLTIAPSSEQVPIASNEGASLWHMPNQARSSQLGYFAPQRQAVLDDGIPLPPPSPIMSPSL